MALIGKRLSGAVLGLRGSFKGATWDIFAGHPLGKPQGFQTAKRALAWFPSVAHAQLVAGTAAPGNQRANLLNDLGQATLRHQRNRQHPQSEFNSCT